MEESVRQETRLATPTKLGMAEGYYLARDYQHALQIYDSIVDIPWYASILRAACLAQLGRLEDAKRLTEATLAIAPPTIDTAEFADNLAAMCVRKEDAENWRVAGVPFAIEHPGPDFDAGPHAFLDTAAVMMLCDAVEMDFSFLDFDDQTFDLIWCRHALEHSFMPLFVLSEIHRVTKPGGVVYIEVPSPGTNAQHERNPNHYSVLGLRMWLQLIQRAGFVDLSHFEIGFPLAIGPDSYMGFICRRAPA